MKQKSITIRGVHLFPHQKEVAELLKDWDKSRGKTIVVKSSRQKGKSILISQALLKYAIGFGRSTKNFYVAPTLRQSRLMYEIIVKGVSKANIIRKSNSTELTIEFINGSTIGFKSAEMRDALRGYTCTGILALDECSFIQDDAYYSLIKPWGDVAQAVTLMVSSPFTRTGFFYQHYAYGLEGTHNCITIDWSDPRFKESIEQLLPFDKLMEYKEMLPEKIFRNEYLGEFIDDDGVVFSLRDCFKEAKISPTDRLYCGIDWSNQTENDDSVLSIFNQDGHQVLLRYWNNLTPLGQIDKLYNELVPYLAKIAVIVCETNSLGTPYTDLLKNKSQQIANKVVGFNTSNQSKSTLVVNFQTALEQGKVTLLPDTKQKEQFGYFSCDYNPRTRNITYAAPNNLHDDCVLATLFASEALRQGTTTGNYNLYIKTHRYGRH